MATKSKSKKTLITVCVIAVVVIVGFLGLQALNSAFADMPASENYKTAEVETGSIVSTLTAASNLTEAESAVELPYGVKVLKVYVEPGDYVTKGDRVASINTTSLSEVLKDARKQLEAMDLEIGLDGANPGLSSTREDMAKTVAVLEELNSLDRKELYATTSGIVKTVNIVEGEALSRTSSSLSGNDTLDLSGLNVGVPDYSSMIPSASDLASQIDWSQLVGSLSEAELAALIAQIMANMPEQTTMTPVPNLIGTNQGQAETLLEAFGLVLGDVTETAEGAPENTQEGLVFAQAPVAGEIVQRNTRVNIKIYKKPPVTEGGSVDGGSVDGLSFPESGDSESAEGDKGTYNLSPADAVLQNYKLLSPEEARAPTAIRTMASYGGITQDFLDSATGSSSDNGQTVDTDPVGQAVIITPVDTYAVKVMIDEMDILSVKEGQPAKIEFDAIPEKTFDGIVTKVGSRTSGGSGVAQYAVTIILPRDDEMRIGMNVTVIISTSEKSGVLKLPAAAVQEDGDGYFVYTAVDENGLLAGPVRVTTGMSDGEAVEIQSGVSAGTTVYYEEIIKNTNNLNALMGF